MLDLVRRMIGVNPENISAPDSVSQGTAEKAMSHQDDLVTPGSSPAWAISRRQMRHSPNLR